MPDCIFCKIVKKEIPCQNVYENDEVLAFKDISPQAPVHILIIPKKHHININDVDAESSKIFSHLYQAAQIVAQKMGIDQKGYRCVINTNPEGGQTVYHLHLHVLGGQQMGPSMVG